MEFASEDVRKWLFESAQTSPGTWLIQAIKLRDAARRIDWVNADQAEVLVTSFPIIYRFLISLSIENLVKGILIAERMRREYCDPLRGLMTHGLKELAEEIQGLPEPLTTLELDLLSIMAVYIKWAGRYPFPRRLDQYQVRAHSSAEHKAEIELWNRLAAYLKTIGWFSMGEPSDQGWHFMFL